MEAAMKDKDYNVMIIAILFIAAVLMRFYGLWAWPFYGDELFTVRDSLNFVGLLDGNTKPGNYLLVNIMFKLFGVSELTARLPSFIIGVLSIPVFYIVSEKAIGKRAAFFGALMLLFSDWHLYQTQFSRFYTAVFLFGAIGYFSLYSALTEGKVKYVIISLIANIIGILFHSTMLVVTLSCYLMAAAVFFFKGISPNQQAKKVSLFFLVPITASGLLIVPVAMRILSGWQSRGITWGYDFFHQAMAITKYLSVGVVVAAVAGLYLIATQKDRFVFIFFLIPVAVSIVFQLSLSSFMNIRPDYTFSIISLFFALAGYCCAKINESSRFKNVAGLVVCALVISSMLPQYVSYFTGKASLSPKQAVTFLENNVSEGDRIVNFSGAFKYYWPHKDYLEKYPGFPIDNNIDWKDKFDKYLKGNDRVWFIFKEYRAGISPRLKQWLLRHTTLVWERKSKRYDYTTEEFRIFILEKSHEQTRL
jgi:uncharacterized membrane protein